jgi:tRNA(fMet)-specific endonuclease VapC
VIILDTDALSHLQKNDPVGILIESRIDASPDRDVQTTSINLYEMLSGAMKLIERRKKEQGDLIAAFKLFQDTIDYVLNWEGLFLRYDAEAEQIYKSFPPRLRQELKEDARIAAVAISNDAVVWTCNLADYVRVPGLTVVDARTGLKVSSSITEL